MSLSRNISKALTLPPHVTLRKATAKALGAGRSGLQRWVDRRRSTYARAASCPEGALNVFFRLPRLDLPSDAVEALAAVAELAIEHRFDLLGSGWTHVRHGALCRGVSGPPEPPGPAVEADTSGAWLAGRVPAPCTDESRRIWSLIEAPYEPIDWHLDFKSGHRWPATAWHHDVTYGDVRGADVKVPWELARMQHLPQLAMACIAAKNRLEGPALLRLSLREFRSQILDFLATNPPRFGVNWSCPMDVAIRAVNWLVARDLFRTMGCAFDEVFERVLLRAIVEHGRFIASHLEGGPELRSNHYLADVCGLLFAGAYLPACRESRRWLELGAQEVARETQLQILSDGGGFEASTSYTALAAEIAAWSTALAQALKGKSALAASPGCTGAILGEEHKERLRRARRFAAAMFGAAGVSSQIGDNDCGRFVKLSPRWEARGDAELPAHFLNLGGSSVGASRHGETRVWREAGEDHRHVVALLDSVTGRPQDPEIPAEHRATASVLESLPGREPGIAGEPAGGTADFEAFPEFGAYVYRLGPLAVVLRAGPVGQYGRGGHAHNDQLSFEAAVRGKPLVVDPGSYLYTPDPDARNRFRSTASHNTLSVGGREQSSWEPGARGLFSLREAAPGKVLDATPRSWIGEHYGFGKPHRRAVRLESGRIAVRDICAARGAKRLAFHFAPGIAVRAEGATAEMVLGSDRVVLRALVPGEKARWTLRDGLYSRAYGWLERCAVLELGFAGSEGRWMLSVLAGE